MKALYLTLVQFHQLCVRDILHPKPNVVLVITDQIGELCAQLFESQLAITKD